MKKDIFNKSGQILLITLLVLTVLSMTIIALIIILNRDVRQVASNQKYEQLYNASENILNEIISIYGNNSKLLSDLPSDFSDCLISSELKDVYVCKIFSDEYGIVNADATVTISDRKYFENYELTKDKPFTIKLDTYSESVNMEWDKDIALEFLFVYKTSEGQIKSVSDVFNPANILSSPLNYNSYTDPNSIHKLGYQINNSSNTSRSLSISLKDTEGFNASTMKTISLTITPRYNADAGVVRMNLHPSNETNFPSQARSFNIKAIDSTDSQTPVVKIDTFIYLYPQGDAFWNYSLLTDDFII